MDYIDFVLSDDFSTCSTYFLALAASYFVIFKILKLFSSPEPPVLSYCRNFQTDAETSQADETETCAAVEKSRIEDIIERCPLLKNPYCPPVLWGRNGHAQTAFYGILGSHTLKRAADKRHYLVLPDGSTVTFDIFEPPTLHSRGEYTLALCPGIANSSESNYIRTCVHHAQEAGFRCAVLNHLGALKEERLTSPRVFRYGGTEEYAAMVSKLVQLYPNTKVISVGFSMGANIVTKYLGEKPSVGDRLVMGISVCQGYDAIRTSVNLQSWESGRRIYEFIMTENVKALLRRHYNTVVQPFVEQCVIDETLLWASTSFFALDENYTRRVAGFKTLESYYEWCSSINLVDKITVPMFYVNALDDPLVPPALWEPVKKYAESKPNVLFTLTKHGGHLGFLEGPSYAPKSVSWLDRLIVQLSNAAVDVYGW